uniref:Uncharacterized protein n=1 Tax=Romanomermis culicivorax TaxID=13658 RepID=A0A915IYP1_ROMCU
TQSEQEENLSPHRLTGHPPTLRQIDSVAKGVENNSDKETASSESEYMPSVAAESDSSLDCQ